MGVLPALKSVGQFFHVLMSHVSYIHGPIPPISYPALLCYVAMNGLDLQYVCHDVETPPPNQSERIPDTRKTH